MNRVFGSLTNRIFLATALLAVATIATAVFLVNSVVTRQAERELTTELNDTSTLVEQFQLLTETQLQQQTRLIADLPKLKAALAVNHGPTLEPLAIDYRQQLGAAAVVLTDPRGVILARDGIDGRTAAALTSLPSAARARTGTEGSGFLARGDAVYFVVTTPVWIDPAQPELLGTLSVAAALDEALATRLRAFTGSELAFTWEGRVRATTRPASDAGALDTWLASSSGPTLRLGGEDFMVRVMPLHATPGGPDGADDAAVPGVVLLRSQTEHLRFLATLHRALAATALVAVLLATVLAYVVARTITRPIRAVTAAMHEVESTGTPTAPVLPPLSPFDDEDARGLAQTFTSMTAAIARFQQEATQRERLSSLGRLSTVIAHEVRNPLMIIKTAVRALRRAAPEDDRLATAITDIDEEVARLNRLVNDVLDFAKPIRFDIAPADVRGICEGAALAAMADGAAPRVDVRLPPGALLIDTDAERVRAALVNLLVNARQSVVAAGSAVEADGDAAPVLLEADAPETGDIRLVVRDRGTGIAPADLPHIFDPFFTTRRTGSGLGLAIVRNVIEGLGGRLDVQSRLSEGTAVTITLPRHQGAAPHTVSA